MGAAHRPTVGYLVWRLSMKWRAAVDAAVAPLGLTHAQYSVLASLRGVTRSGEMPTQRELADHTGLDPIYISKLAKALEASGLIERVPDAADTRAVRLHLSTRGEQVIGRAIAIVGELQRELAAPLGGSGSARTARFVRELEGLLAAPSPSFHAHDSQPNGADHDHSPHADKPEHRRNRKRASRGAGQNSQRHGPGLPRVGRLEDRRRQ